MQGGRVRIRLLLAATALVGFGAFASGCNDDGGGTLTLEEYFEKVAKLDDEQTRKSDEIDAEIQDLGEDPSPDQVADSFQEQIDLLDGFRADLDDINPPSEVEDAHNEVVRALDAAGEQFGELVTEFREAESVEAAFGAFDDSDFSELEKAMVACRELEQIAADNNIEVDFDCDDDE